jgi:hypothetical protein
LPVDARSLCFISSCGLARHALRLEITGRDTLYRLQHGPHGSFGHLLRYSEALRVAAIGKFAEAQTGPASISASACSTVTPIRRRRAESPNPAPTARDRRHAGWTIRQRWRDQIDAGIARFRTAR